MLLNRCLLIVIAVISSAAHADVLYVDDDAPLGGDGLSWNTAYRFLRDALHAAASDPTNTEIHVAQGIYLPDRDEANPDPGPFSDCCWGSHGPGCDDPDCEAAVCALDPYCCDVGWVSACVVVAWRVCDLACPDREAAFQLLNGVALMGGFAGIGAADPDERDIAAYETILSGDLLGNDGPDFANNGENSYIVVTGSATDETAALDGFMVTGGNNSSSPQSMSAGMYNIDGSPTVSNCTFYANSSFELGGGMVNHGGSPTITNCTFSANRAIGLLGPGSGGGMFNRNGDPTVVNCTFNGNTAGSGGGMSNAHYSGTIVINCTFSGNSPSGMRDSSLSNTTVANCIFWANTSSQILDWSNTTTVSFSDVEGGFAGIGNIDADPLFADPNNGDYRLSPGSRCIDAGDNAAVPKGILRDLDGNRRFVVGATMFQWTAEPRVDMGAYEYQPTSIEQLLLHLIGGPDAAAVARLLGPRP